MARLFRTEPVMTEKSESRDKGNFDVGRIKLSRLVGLALLVVATAGLAGLTGRAVRQHAAPHARVAAIHAQYPASRSPARAD
jgi:hypothetical protein